MTIIFTDGAARGNPGPGGWGSVVATDDLVIEMGGGEEHTTNNRMELNAAIEALEIADRNQHITVYTDSAYVLSGITRWVKGWVANDWKTSQKKDVINRDLWERLIEACTHRNIAWKLLKGHSGIPANERCDVIATSYADSKAIVLYNGSRIRYGVPLTISDAFSDTLGKNSSSQNETEIKKRTKNKAYSYVSLVDGVIQTHKTWEECKTRVHGVTQTKFKKSVSQYDEEEIIKEFLEK